MAEDTILKNGTRIPLALRTIAFSSECYIMFHSHSPSSTASAEKPTIRKGWDDKWLQGNERYIFADEWDGKRYVISNDPHMALISCALGIIDEPVNDNGILIIPSFKEDEIEVLDTNGCELIWDARKDERLHMSAQSNKLDYHDDGTLPAEVAQFFIARPSLKSLSTFFRDVHFVTDSEYAFSTAHDDRAKEIYESLTLGIGTLGEDVPEYPLLSIPTWKQQVLNSNIMIAFFPKEHTPKDTKMFQDYAFYTGLRNVWKNLLESTPLCVMLNLNDTATAAERIKEYGKTIGIESYIDAYISGVPVEDIFA